MATLALAVAGAAVGGALLPAGITVLGATLSGAAIGAQIGAFAGSAIDNALFAASGRTRPLEGPRLQHVHLTASTEGSPIPRLYGKARLGGQVIWADEIREEIIESTAASGSGKGLGVSGGGAASTKTIEYRYYASFAIALCEGPIRGIGRVWADGREYDLSDVLHRIHDGSETQAPDSLIAARLGASSAPAFRGTAYIVFQDLPLAQFGNRIPQLSFEVERPVEPFGEELRGVVLIPGSGEFVYAPDPVVQTFGGGRSVSENVHTLGGRRDWHVALDQMQRALPNAKAVSLIVSWFGSDLRASHCELKPGVERYSKVTSPIFWSVAGVDRAAAYVVSRIDDRPAYGGTPSDQTVVAAIQDLKARGIDVILTPFILMDVPAGNELPNPYGGTGQPVYPWRGRITVHPAPGEPGTPDKTAAASAQLANFIGTAAVSDFALSGASVTYTGPAEWSYRRMILHYAHLAKVAGGVSAFVIGTELRGLTQVRSSASAYPFVAALVQLAADVKSVLGPDTKVTYAADWSEYFGHQPADGSGDVYFHLDPLWASANIDAIGIDLYWPLSDWREGTAHRDYLAGWRSIHDVAYLRSNIAGGEGYDWYYASEAARAAQVRTPITDGAGKPWVFRYKDIKSWWSNLHYNRPGGIESAIPTAWVPQSKPFWLTEIGCPAIDKGANQPNVFVDPKSSESFVPHYSRGTRDDLMQRRYIQALTRHFDPTDPDHVAGTNPVSSVYGGRMVQLDRILPYCWDARPFPAFPNNLEVWGDGENWTVGHWLTGRLAGGSLQRTLAAILDDYGFASYTIEPLAGTVPGYVVDRVMSAREALQPLELAYFIDVVESQGSVAFRSRAQRLAAVSVNEEELVEERIEGGLYSATRGQETDLPASAAISFIDPTNDFQRAVAQSRRLSTLSQRMAHAELALVLDAQDAQAIAETWLFESWAARERVNFALPPSQLAIEPGDIVEVVRSGRRARVRATDVADHGARQIAALTYDPSVYGAAPATARIPPRSAPIAAGSPEFAFLDLPLLTGEEPATAGYIAATQTPWPGGVAIYASPETTGFALRSVVPGPCVMGHTLTPLMPGSVGRIDRAAALRVDLGWGTLVSESLLQVLSGRNVAALRAADGEWEIVQFLTAELVGSGIYELRGLLRGQAGSEHAMRSPLPTGSPFVLLDRRLARLDLSATEIGLQLNWRLGPANRSVADASYVTTQHAYRGVGLRPLAPVHVRGVRDGGDLTISWIRRTRIGGDNWQQIEVPLGEEEERYEVDILDGTLIKRTILSTMPHIVYSAAAQTEDFGAPQTSVAVRIHQMSATFGRGIGRLVVI